MAVSGTRTETAAFGVDQAMSFRLPGWARQQIEEQDAEEASAGASGGATAQPTGPTAVAGDHEVFGDGAVRPGYTIAGGCMAAGIFKHVPTRL